MTLRKATKTALDELHSQGAQPEKLKTSEAIGLRRGRGTVILVDTAGKKTPAGLYWEQKGTAPLPEGGFLQQRARREGNVETIATRDGKRAVTRRWDASGEYKYTQLGKKYYSTLRRNYVVDVPVRIDGKRKNGSTYEIKSHMKMNKLGLRPVEIPLHLSLQQRRERVKRIILRQLDITAPLYRVSDETWWYDPEGSWGVHEETVGVDQDDGTPEEHVILDRRVRGKPLLYDGFLFSHAICEEAFEEKNDNLCAPRQMAALLKTDVGEVNREMVAISSALYGTGEWEDRGATPRMILEYCRRHSYGCVVVHNEEVIETLPGSPILAFAVHEEHCYFYKDVAVRRALARRKDPLTARLRKAQRQSSQTPPAEEWQLWNNEIAPGHFWVYDDDIGTVRAWFLERGRAPKLIMKDETRIRTLVCNLKGTSSCYVHALPEYSGQLEVWVKNLDIGLQYRGEGLPALSLKVLQTLVKRTRERVWLTGEEKAAVLEEHNYCCAMCGSGGELEFDHVAWLSESYDEQRFQVLCVECHREKTANEARMYDDDQLASHFELEVWKQYVESPRPPPLVGKLRECKEEDSGQLQIADVIRCRRSALLYNVHPLPVFCPLDDIRTRNSFDLGDLNFVSKPLKGSFAKHLGYAGPGWQHRVQTEWLLHTGVIQWEDITHTLTATAHLPAGLLAEPLEQMERAWKATAGDNRALAKLSVNSLIGLWAIDEATSIKVRSSTREDLDAPKEGCLTSTFHYEGGVVYDFLTRTRLLTNTSCRPLHDLCMCTEAVRVGQMLLALRVARAIPLELRTDSVLFKPRKRDPVRLDELTFRDLDTLYTRGFPLARPPVQLTQIPSTEHPFRQAAATEGDRLTGGCGGNFCPWTAIQLQPRDYRDCSPEEGERRVLGGESLLVLGIAGVGKTHYCRGVVERLRAAGEKVDIISKTHIASRRAGGVTADHWVRRNVVNGSPKCTVLWIDEISQIDVGLLLQICKLTYAGNIRFLLSGDFNQFAPIGNNYRGTPVPEDAVQRSNLLHTMTSGNRVVLTECRRSDRELFDFYASLVGGCSKSTTPLHEVVQQAKARFSFAGFCPHNLVISHRKRIALNRQINQQLAPTLGVVRLEVHGRPVRGNSAQTMLLWPGIQLLGAVPTERRGIRNGCLYTVAEIGDDTVRLEELGGATFTFDQVKSWLRLSYAQTYASVQGTEFDAPLRLHDVGHCFFTRRHLFVGLSRARAARDVSVVD